MIGNQTSVTCAISGEKIPAGDPMVKLIGALGQEWYIKYDLFKTMITVFNFHYNNEEIKINPAERDAPCPEIKIADIVNRDILPEQAEVLSMNIHDKNLLRQFFGADEHQLYTKPTIKESL